MDLGVLDFQSRKKLLSSGGIVAHGSEDLKSAFAPELCRDLGVLEATKLSRNNVTEDSNLKFNF